VWLGFVGGEGALGRRMSGKGLLVAVKFPLLELRWITLQPVIMGYVGEAFSWQVLENCWKLLKSFCWINFG